MKRFLLELIGSTIVSLVVVPCSIIGVAAGVTIWEKKVEPWLDKKIGNSET